MTRKENILLSKFWHFHLWRAHFFYLNVLLKKLIYKTAIFNFSKNGLCSKKNQNEIYTTHNWGHLSFDVVFPCFEIFLTIKYVKYVLILKLKKKLKKRVRRSRQSRQLRTLETFFSSCNTDLRRLAPSFRGLTPSCLMVDNFACSACTENPQSDILEYVLFT